jgi:nitric oxide reductase NorD protein
MAYVTKRKNSDNEVLLLLPIPLYTGSRIYYEEDLEALGLGTVLDGLEEEMRRSILEHARTLARVQPELAFHFLLKFQHILKRIKLKDLGRWVSLALDLYDSQGLNSAREFVLGMDSHPLFIRHWGKGISFYDVYGVLLNYLHGLGREEVALEGGSVHYTDLATIYVPERIALYPGRIPNFLLYKVMVTHKFAQLKLGTYRLDLKKAGALEKALKERYGQTVSPNIPSDLSRFLHLFPDPKLATDIFVFADTARIEKWMGDKYPGLYRELRKLKKQLALIREKSRVLPPRSQVMETLLYWWLTDTPISPGDASMMKVAEKMRDSLLSLARKERSVEDVAETAASLYSFMEELSGPYQAVEGVPYIGELRPEEAEAGRRRKRESTRLKFRQELARLVGDLPEPRELRLEASTKEPAPPGPKTPQQQEVPRHLFMDGNPVPVPEGMQRIIEEIFEDLGCIPSSYLAVTDDMSGHCFRPLCRMPDEDEVLPEHAQGTGYVLPEHGEGICAIDEWDYRRQGYRKRWALLRVTTAPSGASDFADQTLKRYRGMVLRIKRQFERIRMDQTLLRRQKDGAEIDLDAAVEAVTDLQAGLCPSDRVFARLARNKRDIATAFLIDLSGSTSGWINEVARASLLILSEAMQVLQDRFAIYGFSGRTRKRCELFRIKGLYEPYGETVKRRIANLRPLEYTRLGPPIRHLTKLLTQVEARTRLLITLSDGKPDDYDGYNGDYGIEDTRQALIEAKRLGIHPFCITIDKAEHSYLSHMYGAANYVFIDDLSKLPIKVPEIYRKLTT